MEGIYRKQASKMVTNRLKLIDTEGLRAKAFKLPAPLRELRNMSRTFLSKRLSTVFEHVDDTFFDLADRAESNSEQTAYFDAMRMIRLERKSIEQKFLITVDQAFQQLGNVNYRGVSYDSEQPGSFNLEVVENEDLEETIAIGGMVSKVSQHHKHELKKIIARINFMVPAEVISNSNPLGPEVLCNALNDAVEGLEIGIRSRLVLFKLIDRHMIEGLGELLKKSNEMLCEMGVLPDLDKNQRNKNAGRRSVRRSPAHKIEAGSLTNMTSTSVNDKYTDTAIDQAGDNASPLLAQLQSLLQQSEMVVPAAGAEPVALDDLVDLVSNLQGEWVEQKTSEQTLLGLIQGSLQGKGNLGLRSRDHSVVHLLDQLFDRIRKEPGVSGNLGRELRKLEMPILRIALQDGSFFEKEKHPARQLLNKITEASIGYSDDADFTSDPVGKAIANVANILNKSEPLDNEALGKLLMNFMALVEKEHRGTAARELRLVEEVEAKEKVNQARQLVDATLAERMDGKQFPQVFVSFVEDAWCKVMFLAYLRHEKSPEQWQASVQILDELLDYSMKQEVPQDKAAPLIVSVRQRLEDISYDPYDLGCLVGGLEQFFNREVGEEAAGDDDRILDINALPVEEEQVNAPEQKKEAVKPQVQEALLKEVIVEKLKADLPGRSGVDEADSVQEESIGDEFVKIASALGRGSWVDFMDREPPNRRCKVAGIISPPGKYIFVNRQGAKVVEMGQNAVAAGIKDESLVVVESVRMFDRALEQVIRGIRSDRKVH
jgi:Protein of unknown function (DUF1631)